MCTSNHINQQDQDYATRQTNLNLRYQLLGKETNNINRRQLIGSHKNVVGNSPKMTSKIRGKRRSDRVIHLSSKTE